MDLIFPHHENEIAQSCGATGKEFARYWIHNGFVQINQEKMSKSLGNFFTIREIFEKSDWSEEVTGEILRYFLLSTHYHGPLDFSDQALTESKNALNGFYDLFNRLREAGGSGMRDDGFRKAAIERTQKSFSQAMDDDFNTPAAIAALQGLRSDVNKLLDKGLSTEARKLTRHEFRAIGSVLGLFQSDKWQFGPSRTIGPGGISPGEAPEPASPGVRGLSDEEVDRCIALRNEARARKDFKRADEIRKSLASQGVIIEDKPDGTSRWKR